MSSKTVSATALTEPKRDGQQTMISRFGQVASGLAAAAALALGASAPALAAPATRSGAVVINVTNQCFPGENPGDLTFCQDQHDVLNGLDTPSGNQVQVETGHFTGRFYDGDRLVETEQGRVTSLTIFRDGATQVDLAVGHLTMTLPDGTSCTITNHFHFANGQFQYLDGTNTCSPPV
jgi:hypothetical protein